MDRRLSIFAGAGALVPHAVAAALAAGDRVQVLALTPRGNMPGAKLVQADVANPVSILWHLKTFRTTHILMAGGISLGDAARKSLGKFAEGSSPATGPQGDVELSRLGAALKSMTGADLLGVHEIAPELLARNGHIAGPPLDAAQERDVLFALRLARGAGALDVGQAAVSSGSRPVALEDIGGTDALLARVGEHVRLGRVGGGGSSLILAKAKKPSQPMFVDLPAIGPNTVMAARAGGISIIALEADAALVLERAELSVLAMKEGVTVVARSLPHG